MNSQITHCYRWSSAFIVTAIVFCAIYARGAEVGRAISAAGDLNLTTYDVNADGDMTAYLLGTIPLPGFDNDGAFGNEGYRPAGEAANNMFGIGARGTGGGGDPVLDGTYYPFAILDESLAIFPTDSVGIIRGGDVSSGGSVPFDSAPFFGIVNVDLDPGTSNPAGSLDSEQATWLFDVSGSSGSLSVKIDIAAMGDFEATGTTADIFNFDVSLDGGNFVPLFTSSVDDQINQTYTLESGAQVTLDDPIFMDGTMLNNVFQTFSKDVGSAASTLLLRVTAFNNAASEAFAFRNISIEDGGVDPGLEGDFNLDNKVNAADYPFWRDFIGTTEGYQDWRSNFGGMSMVSGNNLVPEPTSGLLLLIGLAAAALWRRR